ncbi:hypothetical protein [Planktothricoides raciborskii]|uniref:Uncharacterized protein n=1 Tax=Planktothricoides raciborskii GIHE-MW2 TaxID=2792601 RepID=A0AAU8JK10_9CYAN|nr:hypothetical protein [Planktothricoides raciborskii]MBD2582367.1 hypothetical protein [Planktothricoides raciborskii FACHB-1261]
MGTQKPGFFIAFTVNCDIHRRNPVSFFGVKTAIAPKKSAPQKRSPPKSDRMNMIYG